MIQIGAQYEARKSSVPPRMEDCWRDASLAGLPLAISQIVGYVEDFWNVLCRIFWNCGMNGEDSLSLDQVVFPRMRHRSYLDIGLNELGKMPLKLLKILAFVDSDGIPKRAA